MPSSVWLFATPWTVTHQAPLSWNFPSQNTGVCYKFLLHGSSWPSDWIHVSCVSCFDRWILYPLGHLGSRFFCMALQIFVYQIFVLFFLISQWIVFIPFEVPDPSSSLWSRMAYYLTLTNCPLGSNSYEIPVYIKLNLIISCYSVLCHFNILIS